MGTRRIAISAGRRAIAKFLAIASFIGSASTGAAAGPLPYAKLAPEALLEAGASAERQQRPAIVDAIIARRAEMLPELRTQARSGSTAERFFACTLLAELRDHDGVDALVAATEDTDVRVRRRAATGLRVLGERHAAPRMRALLRDETDVGVLKTAIAALGGFGLTGDRRRIAPFLEHKDETVRLTAAAALAMLGDESELDQVLAATHSADPGARKTATFALGLFTDSRAGQRLEEIVDAPEGAWKGYAMAARANRELRTAAPAERVRALEGHANNRYSRTLAEWALQELTAEESSAAAAALQRLGAREGSIGDAAARRARILEAAR